jgi:tRNA A22 N-methylase
MVNIFTNINKRKESLNSDGQQFLQYQQNKGKFRQWCQQFQQYQQTKESLDSDGQQFYQYQQNKRNSKQWWSTIPPISTKQKKF